MKQEKKAQATIDGMERARARQRADAWFDTKAQSFEQAAASIRDYKKQFEDAVSKPDQLRSPANVIEWAINDIENFVRTLSFSKAARVASDVNKAFNKVGERNAVTCRTERD